MPLSRRRFLKSAAAPALMTKGAGGRRPNIVLLLTDDQGYGDLSLHGNRHLKTPNLDRIGQEGIRLTQFHVCPVCSPTRSSLLTGRYNYRTGVVDTYLGRSMMYAEETTLAESLKAEGYRTGIFGKWHLGDNYPLRAMDQGFQESLVHGGGGIGQPADPPGNTYFDPVLRHNGRAGRRTGYCTDVFFQAAIEFIEANRERPFFAYLAANAPHDPLEIAEHYLAPFQAQGLDEKTARVYGMVSNIDENTGRLLQRLRKLDLERDTIVVYLTDNGPQHRRFNAGMRGLKGTVYQGGIRVPCFLRWPGSFERGRTVGRPAAHIDLCPTLLEACGVRPPTAIDGRSLMPLLRGDGRNWPARSLFFQWHRGDEPEAFRNCAVRRERYKLVDGGELYDLEADPGEERNLAGVRPELVASLRKEYEAWFRDVSATRGYAPPRIFIGTPHENPVILTRQDWRGPHAGWKPDSVGYWEVDVREAGNYAVKVRTAALPVGASVHFRLAGAERKLPLAAGGTEAVFQAPLERGPGRLEAWVSGGARRLGALYVEVEKAA